MKAIRPFESLSDIEQLQKIQASCLTNSGGCTQGVFKTDSTRFELVITDMNMPHLTGMPLAQELIAFRPALPSSSAPGSVKELTKKKQPPWASQAFL